MKKTLKEIADLVGGEVVGDEKITIKGVAGIKEAQKGEITFVANSRYLSLLKTTQASAIIVSSQVKKSTDKPLIVTENPYIAFTKVMELLVSSDIPLPRGIHPQASIGKNVKLGKDVSIQAFTVVEDYAQIGDKTVLYSNVYVGTYTRIGRDSIIYPNVVIKEKNTIGSRVIIHSGTVIGSDGFGFAPMKGVHHKIPQLGTVIIGDDVEIGANVCVDRATIGKTHIKKGTKIDNLVQIAHNVEIGENSIIVAQAGISGSTTLGKNVTVAGQSGMVGHIHIGDNAVIAAKSAATKDIPANLCVSGFPAQEHQQEKKIKALVQRLPKLYKLVKTLDNKMEAWEKKWNHKEQSKGKSPIQE